jgi:hypothetical protein
MATHSLIFSSPAGSTALVAGRNQIATFPVGSFSLSRVYAFIRPSTPQVTLCLINKSRRKIEKCLRADISPPMGRISSSDHT